MPKNGTNSGQTTSVYKTTNSGNIATRHGKPILRSANALSKIRIARWIKYGGYGLNFVGIGFTIYDAVETRSFTTKHFFDLTFGFVAFVPVWGWAISGIYFLGSAAFSDMPFVSAPARDYRQPYYFENDNTRVDMLQYDLYKLQFGY